MSAGPAFGFTASTNADPLFPILTTITKDLHLRVGSPAIDTGTNTGIATDFDGVTRPQGAAFDIGAFDSPTPKLSHELAGERSPVTNQRNKRHAGYLAAHWLDIVEVTCSAEGCMGRYFCLPSTQLM